MEASRKVPWVHVEHLSSEGSGKFKEFYPETLKMFGRSKGLVHMN